MVLEGKNCLITAGPTYEAIDPVRFIGNRSSGKMGIEIAQFLAEKKANITLILGPSNIPIPLSPNITTIRVESADEMYDAVMRNIATMDLGIFSAAVADYKPKYIFNEKIKKTDENLTIELIKNKDILATVGLNKRSSQIIIGFALETNNGIEYAQSKLNKKNLDMIVLNSLEDAGAGFQYDTNKITILDKYNNQKNFELKTKEQVAKDIIYYIEEHF